MLAMHFGHPDPEMHSHDATAFGPRYVLRSPRRPTLRGATAPTMTLRRDASAAAPADARLSRAPRLGASRLPCLVARRRA